MESDKSPTAKLYDYVVAPSSEHLSERTSDERLAELLSGKRSTAAQW